MVVVNNRTGIKLLVHCGNEFDVEPSETREVGSGESENFVEGFNRIDIAE